MSVTQALQHRLDGVTPPAYRCGKAVVQATTVGFLVIGAGGENQLIAELRREAMGVEILDLGVLDGDGPAQLVTLCWLPDDCEWHILTDLVAWKKRGQRVCGLIGLAQRGDVADRETGLAAGFDDFVAGPLSAKEVAARARALHRRLRMTRPPPVKKLRHGSITIDTSHHQVQLDNETRVLTRTEMAVLAELVRARGRTRSRAQILEAAWGPEAALVGERAVDNVILRLRRKLARPGLIVTVRGVGFRLAD